MAPLIGGIFEKHSQQYGVRQAHIQPVLHIGPQVIERGFHLRFWIEAVWRIDGLLLGKTRLMSRRFCRHNALQFTADGRGAAFGHYY